MNFEPCNPPLLDPFILEQYTAEEIRKKEQTLRHKYVLKKLADFLPKHKPGEPPQYNKSYKPGEPPQYNKYNTFSPNITTTSGTVHHTNTNSICNYRRSSLPAYSPPPPSIPTPNIHTGNTPTPHIHTPTPNIHTPTPHIHTPTPNIHTPLPLHADPKQHKFKATKRFTLAQSMALEDFYEKYGSGQIEDRVNLAQQLGLYKNDVIMWFQSRRRKARRELAAYTKPRFTAAGSRIACTASQHQQLVANALFSAQHHYG